MSNKDFDFNNIIQANPDFFILEPITEDNDNIVDVELIPVIAWVMYKNIVPVPITSIGVCEPSDYVLLLPDKRIQYGWCDFLPSVQDWMDYENDRIKENNSIKSNTKSHFEIKNKGVS